MASYDQLVDKGGTIFNQGAKVAYNSADQLAADLGITKDKIQWGNIAKAGADFNPAGYFGYNAPITSSQLQSPPQVQVPTSQPNNAQATGAMAGSTQAASTAQDLINKAAALQTPEQKQASQYTQDILSLLQQTSGQKQALLEEQNKAGLPQMNQEAAALNADLLRQVAEYNATSSQYDKLITDEEGKVKPMGAIRGEQGRLARARAAELNVKSSEAKITEARIAGKLGQIEQAQAAAKQAVELRYASVTEALDMKTKQLTALQASGILDQQATLQATALAAQYKADQAAIEEKKAKEQSNLQLALTLGINTELANRNGEFFNVRTGKTYATPEELFADTGAKSFEELYSRGMVSNIDNATIQEKSQVGQIMAQYWDAGIKITDTYEQAMQKVKQNSRLYERQVYIAPQSGTTSPVPTGIIDKKTDARVAQLIASRPGDGGYGDAYKAVAKEFGQDTAKAYDDWYKRVFIYGQNISDITSSKPPTEGQNTAAGYATRLIQANDVINNLESTVAGYSATGFYAQLKAPSFAQSQNIQQQSQAERNFVNAVLRKESGAAIAQSEFDNATKQYFPRPGDTVATLEQKAQNRQAAIQSLTRSAGNAFQLPASTTTDSNTTDETITAADGSVWRINPDGSYTRIQ